jgi:hypothetical protein
MNKQTKTIKMSKERVIEFCKKASQDEILDLFNSTSKIVVSSYKKMKHSEKKEILTSTSNKKQNDSLMAKAWQSNRVYNQNVEDLKEIVKYII